MSISIHNGDITKLEVDAIVNAANDRLAPGGGVCGAIHRAAGPSLAEECAKIGGCPTGEARITGGHELPARAVIHTVGPVWHGGGAGESALLASCYRESLKQARKAGCQSVAFPSISAGVFGYPLDKATAVAVETVRAELAANGDDLEVIFCVFGEKAEAAYEKALSR